MDREYTNKIIDIMKGYNQTPLDYMYEIRDSLEPKQHNRKVRRYEMLRGYLLGETVHDIAKKREMTYTKANRILLEALGIFMDTFYKKHCKENRNDNTGNS